MLPVMFPIQCKQVVGAVACSCSLRWFGECWLCIWTPSCRKNTACLPQACAAASTDSPAGAGTVARCWPRGFSSNPVVVSGSFPSA